jgi:DcmR-like sensory protein
VTLLVEAPPGRHFAQFHRDTDALTDSAFVFLEAGLRHGHSLLIIASTPRVEQVFDRLSTGKVHPKSLLDSGQLAVMDSTPIIDLLVAHGQTEGPRFRGILDPVLSQLGPSGRGTRIYTEIANALWDAGETAAAVRLEDLWNALTGAYTFSLFCGYTLDTLSERSYAGPLEELGRTHSDILGTQDDERFGAALDQASKELFGISLTQMAGEARVDATRRFPSGQRTMLWVKRNLPTSTARLVERARQYFADGR